MRGPGISFLFPFLFLLQALPLSTISYWIKHLLKRLLICLSATLLLDESWGCTALAGVTGAQHNVLQCREEAIRWNIMEGSKQVQTAIRLVYRMSPRRCIFPRFNITLSSGLYCQ